jgi:hypothetical protein
MIDKSKLTPGVSRVRCTKGYETTPKEGWVGTYMGDAVYYSPKSFAGVLWDENPDLLNQNMECHVEGLELIEEQPTTMEQELKITKEKVLEAASKCSTAAATLKTLFPEVFEKKDEPYRFEDDQKLSSYMAETILPVFIGDGLAPPDLDYRCLIVKEKYEMRTQHYNGQTIITFHDKKK